MKKYVKRRGQAKEPQTPFTQNPKPAVRFGGNKARPLMHLNNAAVEALNGAARVALSWDEESKVIRISAAQDEGLLLWRVTPFYYGLTAMGFVSWSGIDWPEKQIVEADVLGAGLWIELPESIPEKEQSAEIAQHQGGSESTTPSISGGYAQ